jgi:hypothetical protein
MTCKRCAADLAEPRRCAFPDGTFIADNWACETAMQLRERVATLTNADDQHAALWPIQPLAVFIVLGWYKQRGRTEVALAMDGTMTAPLPLWLAEVALGDREATEAEIESLRALEP